MIISLIVLIALMYGSYTDIKTREIPDTLSIGMIYLGMAIAIGSSLLFWSYKPLLASIIGLGVGAAIGLLFYFTGQWGGGDAKVLMGLGTLVGVDIFTFGHIFPQLGIFMINLVVFGAVYGVLWILWLALKNWKTFHILFRDARREKRMIRVRMIFFITVIVFTIAIIVLKPDFFIITVLYLLMLFFLLSIYLYMIIKVVEKNYMISKLDVKKLTEGDWVIEKVKMKNADKYIYTKTGISEKGINMLRSSGKKKITVKEGVPFLPSFLIAYILTILLGNWLKFLLI
ncbi:MAG: prepilin peptidase [Candidatus Nanoarchaeia archaeon]